jgi:uncharacterized membrane protein
MAFCAKCGAEVAAGATFCAKCGAPQSAVAPAATGGAPVSTASGGTGLAENVAGLLCYVLGWITGLIFLLIDKRPFVKFHAAQALVTFGALHIIQILFIFLNFGSLLGGWSTWILSTFIWGVLGLLGFVLWILCMVKAYQGQRFKLPIVGDIAENIAGKA